ncbi:hypothetical protein APHAL10511_005183 [Amanita phalloides]|nr:hypothetical protein APHAL10511_005183 [Amanita phalloides]
MASEVATLLFVRKYTSVPVPRVIAFDASADNELCFEWMLMSKLPGVTLASLWESPALVWEERVQITKMLAAYVKQLTDFQFNLTGSLYPSRRVDLNSTKLLGSGALRLKLALFHSRAKPNSHKAIGNYLILL